jgi:hypothetical protein
MLAERREPSGPRYIDEPPLATDFVYQLLCTALTLSTQALVYQ